MLISFALQASTDLDVAMTRYREQTRATIECQSAEPDDILVCGRRATDRFRLPLIELDLTNPKNEPVAAERERLLARTTNCEELSTFLVGCGKAGIGVSTRSGLHGLGERPIAP